MGKKMKKETGIQSAGHFSENGNSDRPLMEAPASYDAFVPLSDLGLSNGFLFGEVMREEETCRTVLEIILGRPIGRVVYVNKEQPMETSTHYHKYKGIRLDIYFQDDGDTCYSVEMQTRNRYNLPKRSRHYQGMMDVHMLPAGEIDYNRLSDSIIIFICTFDLFGMGRCRYTFENMCLEQPGLKLSDGAVRLFLNTRGEAGSEENRTLVEFLRYVEDPSASVESPEVKKIQRRVEEVKRDQETEARYMTSLTYIREVYEDGREDGEARGRAEGRIQAIFDLLSELGTVPDPLAEKISKEKDLATLSRWVKLAARAESHAAFEESM